VIELTCPSCRSALVTTSTTASCQDCGRQFSKREGIWCLLQPERVAAIEEFLGDYTRIRHAEGRGSTDPGFYRDLPECPATHPMAEQWRLRRCTYARFCDRVLPRGARQLRILDLGSGTGWLCNRMAQLGHETCGVDLSCDRLDGLGAARYFEADWPRVQAEFDYLPFPPGHFDVLVYNASLHYSTNYENTLREGLRVLAPGGLLVVLETPVYRDESSGRRMVEERQAMFRKRYGTSSDSLPSLNYLTWGSIEQLGERLQLRWSVQYPWYGLRWALRPCLARLRRRREPSRFPVLVGKQLDRI
jgi:SAM-dependent methyltransferase